MEKFSWYVSGAVLGAFLLYTYWIGTHDCYRFYSDAAMLCKTHGFQLDWLVPK